MHAPNTRTRNLRPTSTPHTLPTPREPRDSCTTPTSRMQTCAPTIAAAPEQPGSVPSEHPYRRPLGTRPDYSSTLHLAPARDRAPWSPPSELPSGPKLAPNGQQLAEILAPTGEKHVPRRQTLAAWVQICPAMNSQNSERGFSTVHNGLPTVPSTQPH